MPHKHNLKPVWRAVVEVSFIVFLFYSNLLMGEYARSGSGHANGIWWALNDIFTTTNFIIGLALALIGYLVIELIRKKLS